jgi:outer membrane immunogenic protein
MFTLFRVALAALLLVAIASYVKAADLGGKPVPGVTIDQDYRGWNRTGLYAGVLGGYSAADLGLSAEGEGVSLADSALSLGVVVGFQVRLDQHTIVGLEADGLFMDVSGSLSGETPEGVSVTVRSSNKYLASVRGRVGLPIGPALLYGTGGVAFTDAKASATEGDLVIRDHHFSTGWVAGGGLELGVTNTVGVRLEGLHYWFPDQKLTLDSQPIGKEDQFTTVRAALVFKLN